MTNDPHPQPLTLEEALSAFELTPEEWESLKASVERGSRRFWKKRGLPDPGIGWSAQMKMECRAAEALRLRRAAEKEGETKL